MGINNNTTSFAQSWGSTQGKLVRVEVLVLFSALLWVFVELFGSWRRRHSHGFFRFFVWAVYTLYTVLGPYTIGLLQYDPFHDQTFVLWGAILLLIQVSSDSLSVYSIHDIEQRKRVLVQHMLQIILVLWLIVNCNGHNKSYTATIWIFWIQSVILAYRKSGTLGNASKKGGLLKQSKVVADYMMIEHEVAPGFCLNPKTMQGYWYLFHGEEEVAFLLPTAPKYRVDLKKSIRTRINNFYKIKLYKNCTTIDSVWQWIETESGHTKELKEILKDLALSYTLFKLLKRRLCGYQIGEAGLKKTLNFVLDGLISEEVNYDRAFRVIEMELAFLYDFLYTRVDMKYSFFKGLGWCIVILVTVWNSVSGVFSRHYHRSSLEQRVHQTDVTHWLTIVLLIIVLVLSSVHVLTSMDKWTIVRNLHDISLKRYRPALKNTIASVKDDAQYSWQRALGQYSLLRDFDYHPWNVLPLLSLGLVEATREGQKAGKKITMIDEVMFRVLLEFRVTEGELNDGRWALTINQLGSQFSWACTLPTDIHKILVWHIGTTIAMDSPQDPLTEDSTDDYHVAKTLSDYCAYLVAFVPDMLPGHGYDTQRIFDAVIMEARENITSTTMSTRCKELIKMAEGLADKDGENITSDSSYTILELGAKLGRELIRDVVPEARRWKVLSEFWTSFILFLAPSNNVDIHAERLASGGEFMTHLWALLTHAGILERPSTSEGGGGNDGSPAPAAQESLV